MSLTPLVFTPYLRPQIWGGRALGDQFAKTLPDDGPFGESWEISAHPHHTSVVADGPLQGRSLVDLCRSHSRELFGDDRGGQGDFPLLIKLLDCYQLLSVQVHPDDAQAARLAPGEAGKTEAWVVLDASPDAVIYAGLKHGIDADTFRRHMDAKTTDQCLHRFHPQVGDCVYIPAGTVHTMGGGLLIAEVQQSSDATFRIFDWNRVDAAGKPRALHLAESLEAIDFHRGPVNPVVPVPQQPQPTGATGENLVACTYFSIDRYTLSGSMMNPHPGELTIWIVVQGEVALSAGPDRRSLSAGQTLLIPASSPPATWHPTQSENSPSLLCVRLPARSAP